MSLLPSLSTQNPLNHFLFSLNFSKTTNKKFISFANLSIRIKSMTSAENNDADIRISRIASSIRVIPNFPKPGVMFQDITTLLLEPKIFRDAIDLFVDRYRDKNITVVAGVEARGFIFGPPIALDIGAKFVPLRKPKKLPGEVISEEYTLEYGTDKMEMHVGAVQPGDRVLVVDDLIATGGTMGAAVKLIGRFIPGCYTLAVSEELPEEYQSICDENNVQYVPPKRK